ncbi:MAG: protein kinase [Anaerolineales bacterium]|nr:protein kinase [Anaerolineales bacterium]
MNNSGAYTATSTNHPFPPRWQRGAQLIWGGLLLLATLVFVLATLFYLSQLGQLLPYGIEPTWLPALSPTSIDLYFWVLDTITSLAFLTVALFLFWRKRDSWFMMLVSLMLALFGGVFINNTSYLLTTRLSSWEIPLFLLGLLGNTLFVLFLYLFPEGRFPSRLVKLIAFGAVCWFLFLYLVPSLLLPQMEVPPAIATVMSVLAYGAPFFLPRENTHTLSSVQQQVKWINVGLILALSGFAIRFLPEAFVPVLQEPGATRGIFLMVSQFAVQITLSFVPFMIGFSMLRYRLWDVDFLINRGLVYGAVTVTVGLLVAGQLFILRQLFVVFTGKDQATVALVIAAVAAGALFQPLRNALQRLVDQQVYGIQVAYQKPRPVTAVSIPDATTGKQIGAYTLQQLIGRGGMANVYLAQHPTLHQPVAIKIMLSEQATQADFRARFEREAQTIASLRHEGIVKLFDFGQVDGTYYMVMEYIDGPNLRDFIAQNPALPWQTAVSLLQQIAAALNYAHTQGLVHRDIKPSNVMIQSQATQQPGVPTHRAVLTDFGIVKMMGGSSALTHTGMVGTLDYIAPEQIRDAKDVDGRADLYSLGILAYELVTGERPFTATNPGALLIAHLQQPAPDPRKLRPDLPDAIAIAILRLLAKEPTDRYPTAAALLDAITDISPS